MRRARRIAERVARQRAAFDGLDDDGSGHAVVTVAHGNAHAGATGCSLASNRLATSASFCLGRAGARGPPANATSTVRLTPPRPVHAPAAVVVAAGAGRAQPRGDVRQPRARVLGRQRLRRLARQPQLLDRARRDAAVTPPAPVRGEHGLQPAHAGAAGLGHGQHDELRCRAHRLVRRLRIPLVLRWQAVDQARELARGLVVDGDPARVVRAHDDHALWRVGQLGGDGLGAQRQRRDEREHARDVLGAVAAGLAVVGAPGAAGSTLGFDLVAAVAAEAFAARGAFAGVGRKRHLDGGDRRHGRRHRHQYEQREQWVHRRRHVSTLTQPTLRSNRRCP